MLVFVFQLLVEVAAFLFLSAAALGMLLFAVLSLVGMGVFAMLPLSRGVTCFPTPGTAVLILGFFLPIGGRLLGRWFS